MRLSLEDRSLALKMDRWVLRLRRWLSLPGLLFEFSQDYALFTLACRSSPLTAESKAASYDLMFFAHTIEKGLSLPKPRPLFGRNTICRIVHLLRTVDPATVMPTAVDMAMGGLEAYLEFHAEAGATDPFLNRLKLELDKLQSTYPGPHKGGLKNVAAVRQQLQSQSLSYVDFLKSRYSCRTYLHDPIPDELVTRIISTAQAAPSQCNRQSTRVHVYTKPEQVREILLLQGGSRGFSENVPLVFVITNELVSWTGRADRNQSYVDSSLFAMSLLYSCHAHGLGTCSLNFGKYYRKESRFKKAAGIPWGHRVSVVIAAGFQDPQRPFAARSERLPVEEVMIVH